MYKRQAILNELSERLTESLGKGFSVENLKLMRRFYVVYSQDQIGQKVSTQFENLPVTKEGRKFFLSFSHYVSLMRIQNIDERHFYEIEAVRNGWGVKELGRQYDSEMCIRDRNGTERIRHCLRHFLGASADEYTYQVLQLFMLGAVPQAFCL